MEAGSLLLGVVGKTNVGKSTFFSAATEVPVKIENRPFVTIEPNVGVAHVRVRCAHVSLGLARCDPVNSLCIDGWRFVPVKLLDVAGLVPGAHMGRGLGNRFLDHVRRADALLLVVDASGSTGPEGTPAAPGSYDPAEEASSMIREIEEWMFNVISRDWDRFARRIDTGGSTDPVGDLAQRLSGFSVTRAHVVRALEESGLVDKRLSSWTRDELRSFVSALRRASKPIVIVANKSDSPHAREGVERLREAFPGIPVVPTSSLAELLLRRLSREGLVKYIPGDPGFKVVDESRVDEKTRKALGLIKERVIEEWGGTGVQEAINKAVLEVLGMIVVYPVEDPNKYTDSQGRVLPDAILLARGSTPRDLAYAIHSDLGDSFLYAIDARTKQRLGESHRLKGGDVIKIVAAKAKGR